MDSKCKKHIRVLQCLDLQLMMLMTQHRRHLSPFCALRTCFWFIFNMEYTRICSVEMLFLWSTLSLYCCKELFLPRYRTSNFPFMIFLSTHFSSPSRFLWTTAQSSALSTTATSLYKYWSRYQPPGYMILCNMILCNIFRNLFLLL